VILCHRIFLPQVGKQAKVIGATEKKINVSSCGSRSILRRPTAGKKVDLEAEDNIHTVAGLFKVFFRYGALVFAKWLFWLLRPTKKALVCEPPSILSYPTYGAHHCYINAYRELPEPLLTFELYDAFLVALRSSFLRTIFSPMFAQTHSPPLFLQRLAIPKHRLSTLRPSSKVYHRAIGPF
jgi:hypothetical protein